MIYDTNFVYIAFSYNKNMMTPPIGQYKMQYDIFWRFWGFYGSIKLHMMYLSNLDW